MFLELPDACKGILTRHMPGWLARFHGPGENRKIDLGIFLELQTDLRKKIMDPRTLASTFWMMII